MSATHLIVGAGKMGGSLIRGWLENGTVNAKRLAIVDPHLGTDAVYAVEKGARHIDEPHDIPNTVKVVLLAVKPQMVSEIAKSIAGYIPPNALVISIMAGTSIAQIERMFGARPIIRAMPNTPSSIGEGITAITGPAGLDPAHLDTAEQLLSAVGIVRRVETEALINSVTAISGSGPAYIFHLCEALELAAKDVGLPKDLAPEFARQTIIGAAALLAQSDETPETLRRNVTSPNGTTQAALDVLMAEDGLAALMRRAAQAALKRAEELAQDED
ncbi:pyrroline-5-carboxylate reductase [Litorimonas sp. RW-G-Af-16]|uniref:pyrroline-5-carboxylate reductase n=1 Tax=Litorimonas sp. RW-G-Af-16 TaxID=3241168 RepID=UPI00390C6376